MVRSTCVVLALSTLVAASCMAGTANKPNTWARVADGPSASPSARDSFSMVYVPIGGKRGGNVIVFGGNSTDGLMNDTWAYDPVADLWTELKPSGALPPPRWGQCTAYDPSEGQMIVFGGWNGSEYLNDTWTYDLAANAWTEQEPAGTLPTGRVGYGMAFDIGLGRAIMFGGWNQDGSRCFGDTWSYDPSTNTWIELNPPTSPSPRASQPMAYDDRSERMIIFGGWNASAGNLDDTWAYDSAANTWRELQPHSAPSARDGEPMVYDSTTGKLILFGGARNGGDLLRDTWAYDPTANTWTELEPSGKLPAARLDHWMVYDSDGDRVILFGGAKANWTRFFSDVWFYTPRLLGPE